MLLLEESSSSTRRPTRIWRIWMIIMGMPHYSSLAFSMYSLQLQSRCVARWQRRKIVDECEVSALNWNRWLTLISVFISLNFWRIGSNERRSCHRGRIITGIGQEVNERLKQTIKDEKILWTSMQMSDYLIEVGRFDSMQSLKMPKLVISKWEKRQYWKTVRVTVVMSLI
jgi:hypothetical protein